MQSSLSSPARSLAQTASPVSLPEASLIHTEPRKSPISYAETYPLTYGPATETSSTLLRSAAHLEFGHPSYALSCSRHEKLPSTVLDVACGVFANWIIEAAQHVDFKNAHFTGLEIAPIRLNMQILPDDIAARVSTKKSDILRTPWPFPDNSFDMVRLGHLSTCVPDHRWSDIFDEASRVCSSHGLIEVIDTNSHLGYKEHCTSFSPKETVAEQYKREILDCDYESDYLPHAELHASVEKRYLSTYPLSTIPSTLLLSAKIVDSTSVFSLSVGESAKDAASTTETRQVLTSSKAPQKSNLYARLALARAQTSRHRENAEIYQNDFWAGLNKPPSWRDSQVVWNAFTNAASDVLHIQDELASAFDWRMCMSSLDNAY